MGRGGAPTLLGFVASLSSEPERVECATGGGGGETAGALGEGILSLSSLHPLFLPQTPVSAFWNQRSSARSLRPEGWLQKLYLLVLLL